MKYILYSVAFCRYTNFLLFYNDPAICRKPSISERLDIFVCTVISLGIHFKFSACAYNGKSSWANQIPVGDGPKLLVIKILGVIHIDLVNRWNHWQQWNSWNATCSKWWPSSGMTLIAPPSSSSASWRKDSVLSSRIHGSLMKTA